MNLSFNEISRAGLDAASVATSIGFTAAKLGTRLGVRLLPFPLTLARCSSRHFKVLHNTRYHYNRRRSYRLCARLWPLWRAY